MKLSNNEKNPRKCEFSAFWPSFAARQRQFYWEKFKN